MQQQRIESILEVLLQYTLKDFSEKIPISEKGDELDAIAVGVNTMGEELDITLREIENVNNHLIYKNKELEQFTYIASHDLQEPLLTVSSYVSVFTEEYEGQLDDQAKMYLKYINEASTRMRSLVKGLMDYALIGAHAELAWVDCDAVFQKVLQEAAPMIEETSAEIEVKNLLPTVYGYKNDLLLLFTHLLSNALKFHDDGSAPIISLGSINHEDHWEFYIKDNGIGIAPKQLDKIFTIFQRLHSRKSYDGTGIGLAHCRKIVEMHQGKIWAESVPGKESTFKFTIKKMKL